MSKQEEIIRESLSFVLSNGNTIGKNILYDLTSTPIVYGVDAAILFYSDSKIKAGDSGWLQEVCNLLQVDHFWLRRLWLGFDRNYQVLVRNKDDEPWKEDLVSKLGIKLAREFVNKQSKP